MGLCSSRILICETARGSLGSPRPLTPVDFSSRRELAIASPSLRNVLPLRIQLSSRPLLFRVPSPPTPGSDRPKGRPTPTCLDFTPSSRPHTLASTSLQGFPCPRIRSALKLSQLLDGFLRTRACGPISSRYHVQGRPVQGLLLPRSHPSSSEGAYPHAVVRGALIAEAMSARRALGFEVLIRVRVRCIEHRLFIRARPASLFRFFSSRFSFSRRAPVLLRCSAHDVSVYRLRFRARGARSSSAFAPQENRPIHLCLSQPARVLEPAVRKS